MYHLSAFFVVGEDYFELLDRMPKSDIGTGDYYTSPFPLPSGGTFDALGEDDSNPKGYTLKKSFVIWYSDSDDRIDYYKDLRGLVGKRGRLYRAWDNDSDVEWVTARLKSVSGERELNHKNHVEVDLSFEIYSSYWHGDYTGVWLLDSGEFFDTGLDFDTGNDVITLNTSPKSFTITMNGNAIVNDAIIYVIAGSNDITALEIKNTTTGHLAELDYSGTITAGNTLTIDCGAYTVKNNGVDDDANFSLGSTHAINEWLRLAPGDNTIVVTFTGGSTDSTINFDYYEGWK